MNTGTHKKNPENSHVPKMSGPYCNTTWEFAVGLLSYNLMLLDENFGCSDPAFSCTKRMFASVLLEALWMQELCGLVCPIQLHNSCLKNKTARTGHGTLHVVSSDLLCRGRIVSLDLIQYSLFIHCKLFAFCHCFQVLCCKIVCCAYSKPAELSSDPCATVWPLKVVLSPDHFLLGSYISLSLVA